MSRSRRRRWFIAIGAVLALALFVTVGIFSPALNLQKITVVGAQRLDPAAVSASLGEQLGKPLALVDQQGVQDALSQFTLIQEYSIETLPPHELLVRIVERKPVLNLKRGESFDLVDPAGVVIQSAPERIAGYPIGEALVVDVNSAAFSAAAQSLAYMQADLAAQVDVASATTDQDVTFKLASGLTIIWGSAEKSARKSVLVNTMLTALAGRSISTINVSSTEAPVFS
jgi:cell division protein FtsQ